MPLRILKYLSLVVCFTTAVLFSGYRNADAQELNCKVEITPPQIRTASDQQIYDRLKTDVREFLNTRKWTSHVYSVNERIDCTFNLIIKNRVSTNEFEAELFVQSSRPVHNSSYNTVLLNYNDKDFKFLYQEFQPVVFNEAQFNSNLSSVLAYYVYIILGLDYDSFSPQGGTNYYKKAQNIVNNAQNAPFAGWRANESIRNRFWLVENFLNSNYANLRMSVYNYHRLGLDLMSQDVLKGREGISNSMDLILQSHRERPGSLLQEIYMNAKSTEIIDIYKGSNPPEKGKIVPILNEIDGVNASKYQEIKSG